MSYEALLDTIAKAAIPALWCVGMIVAGVFCDMWTNTVASEGKRVWRQVQTDVRNLFSN